MFNNDFSVSCFVGLELLMLFCLTLLCRLDIIESILCGSLFPAQFSINDMVKRWVGIFSGFDKVEVKALEKILEQKQRYAMFYFLIHLLAP